MKLPSINGVGSMAAQTATQNPTWRLGPCNSGNLLILMAGKRAGSNFTFPTDFTKAQEIAQTGVTSGMASAIAWKWGALADSGSSIVTSTSGAGNLFHAVSLALQDVESSATPLEGYITDVWSQNYSTAGSLQPVGQSLGVCCIVAFDNVAVTAAGFTANSWAIANSHTTTTGSDGQIASFLRNFLLANSGAFFNPNSSAGTAPRHGHTFYVRGVPDVTEATRESTFNLTDDYVRGATIFFKIAESAFFALDNSAIRRAFAVLANEGLVIDDAFVKSIIGGGTLYTETLTSNLSLTDTGWSGRFIAALLNDVLGIDDGFILPGGVVYTATRTDETAITDALVRAWQQIRMLGSAFTTADEVRLRRDVNRAVSDALAASDEKLRTVLRQRLLTEATTLADEATSRRTLSRLRDDSFALTDAIALYRRLTRSTDDALTFDDSALRQGSSSKTMNDSLQMQDGALAFARKQRLAADVATVMDELRASRRVTRMQSSTIELIELTEWYRTHYATAEDAVTAADVALRWLRLQRVSQDAITLDSLAAALVAGGATFRTATALIEMLDEVRTMRRFGRVASDLLTLDEKKTFLLFLNRADAISLSDSAHATRLLLRVLQDAITLSDPVIALVAGGVRVRVADDTITIDDGVQRITMRRRIVGDTITLTDFAVAATAGLRVRTLDDGMTVSDGKVSGAVRNKLVQDLIAALNDQAVRGTVRWRLLADALSPADFSLKMLARTLLLSSEATLDDGALQARISVRGLYDILEITDSFTKTIADALVNLLDVRIMIGAALFAPSLGSHSITLIGADAGPILGGYN